MSVERSLTVSIEHLHPFTLNPRRLAKASDSLVSSLKAQGQLQSLLVRPFKEKKGDYEVVCGNRRLDGLPRAGIETAEVRVREMTDEEAIEAALTENDQREGVPPLEESDAYQALVDRGYTPERIAERLGKSVAHVRSRLRLQRLSEEARDALGTDRLTLASALVLAQVEDAPTQKAVLEELLVDAEGRVPTAAAVREIVRGQLHVLADAPFDRADEKLAGVGACGRCPKRTAAQAELFGTGDEADRCLDTACWRKKAIAAAEVKLEALAAAGVEALDGAATEKALGYARDRVTSQDWKDLDEQPAWELREHLGVPLTSKKNLRDSLGKRRLAQLQRFALVDRTGVVHEVVKAKELTALVVPPKEKAKKTSVLAGGRDVRLTSAEEEELARRVAAAVATRPALSWHHILQNSPGIHLLRADKGPIGAAARPLFASLEEQFGSMLADRAAALLLLADLVVDPPGPDTDLSEHGIDVARLLADIRAEAIEKALIEKQRGASKNIKAGKKKDPKAVKAAKGAA